MLSFDEIKEFERQGFIGPFNLRANEFEGWRQKDTEQLAALLCSGINWFYNHHLYSKSLVELVTSESILSRVKAILGPDVLLWLAHVIARPSGDSGQPWHSDSINQYIRGLHVSLAISGMNSSNGCLKLIPGSHLYRASLKLRSQNQDLGWAVELADSVAPWNAPHKIVEMEISSGQFFFTWGGLWHCVGQNDTKMPRLASVSRFARTDVSCRNYGNSDAVIKRGRLQPCLLASGHNAYPGLNKIAPSPTRDIFEDSSYARSLRAKIYVKKLVSVVSGGAFG